MRSQTGMGRLACANQQIAKTQRPIASGQRP